MTGGKKDLEDATRVVREGGRHPRVGDVLKERFELIELLGEGGMGKVFKALDRVRRDAHDRDPYVALKVLSPEFSRFQESTIALQREAKKALALTHSNIIRVYDFDRDHDIVFMTMELLSGRSLDALISAPGFEGVPLERALQIIRPAAAALAHAHEAGFVHCDFKPSNVFLTEGGQVKVIDLGIARGLKRPDASADRTLFDPAELRAMSPPYASPEQIGGQEPDPRDDVYALACVTYELVAGKHPFDRVSALQAMTEGRQPKKPAGLDQRRWAALKRALSFQRSARTPSVAQFMQEFALPTQGAGRSFRAWLAACAVGLAVAAGIAAWLLWPSTPPPLPTLLQPQGKEIGQTPPPAETVETHSRGEPPASTEPVALPDQQERNAEDLRSLVRAVPCSLMQVDASTGTVRLQGYVHSEAELASLTQALKTQPGISGVVHSLSMIEAAYCPPIDVVRRFVFAAHDASSPLAVRPAKPVFVTGDSLMLDIIGDDKGGYITVDYYDVSGNVVHMLPRPGAAETHLKPGARLRLGTGGEWGVSPPYGRDLAIVIQTPEPPYRSPRKQQVELAADYLPGLQDALDRLARRHGAGAVLAGYTLVTTQQK